VTRPFVLLLLFLSFSASGAQPEASKKKKFNFSIMAGGRASSNLERRGATLYDSWQLSPFLYFGFFEDRIQFLVNSIEYVDFLVPGLLRGRTGFFTVSDRPFFKTGGEPTGFRNQRRTSYEWTSTLELFLPERANEIGELDLIYSKDLKAHSGHYVEVMPRITLAQLFPDAQGKPQIQPQLFASVGWGDRLHNSYQYGSEAEMSGWNNFSYGLMVLAPTRLDSHYPVLTVSHYQVLGQSKQGNWVADKTSGFNVSALVAFAITK
jgi:hypothetical protein